jgi:hypothetical protein
MKRFRTNAAIETKNKANARKQEEQNKQDEVSVKQTSNRADKATKKD